MMEENKTIEDLPEGWKRVKLGEVIEGLIGGGTPLRSIQVFWENGDIPWLTNEEVKDNEVNYIYDTKEKITYKAYKHTNVKLIPPNSVILSLTASIGKVAINKIPLTTNQQFNSLVLKKSVLNYKFLAYYLLNSKDRIKNLGGLTTFDFISKSKISQLIILLPPLSEQQKIAEILETIDNAIESTDKIIEKYKRIKQGLMQELLTKGIDEKGNIRNEETHQFKDSPVGRIPVEWEVKRLGEVCEIKGGKRLPKGEELIDDGFPYIRLTDILNSKIDFHNIKCISSQVRKKLNRYIVFEGDVIISIVGTIGLVASIPKELNNANLTENAARLTNLKELIGSYLANLLASSIIQLQINKMIGIVAQPKLAIFRLAEIIVIKPPMREQQRIAEILSQIDNTIEKEQKYKEKLQRLKQGLMEDLLTGKVRVNNLITNN